jgi:hypothetical protein
LYALPFSFCADEAFPFLKNMLKLYLQKDLSSRARRTVENVSGIMASGFRVFHTDAALAVHNIDAFILACLVLRET